MKLVCLSAHALWRPRPHVVKERRSVLTGVSMLREDRSIFDVFSSYKVVNKSSRMGK